MSGGQRLLLRFVSALVGLVLVAAGLLAVGNVVAWLAGEHDFLGVGRRVYRSLHQTSWGAQEVVYTGIALLVLGLLLLMVSLVTKPRLISLAQPTEGLDVVIAPRAVAQMLRRQAEGVPGVASASVEVTAAVARVSVLAPLASPDRVQRDLEEAVTHALKKIPWTRLPRLELEVASDRPVSAATGPLDAQEART